MQSRLDIPILIRINKPQGPNLLSARPNLLRLGGGGSRLMHPSIGLAWETAKWLPWVGARALCGPKRAASSLLSLPYLACYICCLSPTFVCSTVLDVSRFSFPLRSRGLIVARPHSARPVLFGGELRHTGPDSAQRQS